jgi:hypothetical protein
MLVTLLTVPCFTLPFIILPLCVLHSKRLRFSFCFESVEHKASLVIPASVITDFSCNGSCLHSPAFSLCFIAANTSVTPVCHISDLRLHHTSPTFSNSVFSSAIVFLAQLWTVHNGYCVFWRRGLISQSDMKTAYVI